MLAPTMKVLPIAARVAQVVRPGGRTPFDRVAQVVTFEAACLVAAPSAQETGELPQTMALDEGEPVPVLDAGRVAAWLGSR